MNICIFNLYSFQVIPRTQRLHSNEHRPLSENELLALLIPKLEEVKRKRDLEERARLEVNIYILPFYLELNWNCVCSACPAPHRVPVIALSPRRYAKNLRSMKTTTKTFWTSMCRVCGKIRRHIARPAQCLPARPYHREDAPQHMTPAWSVMVP